MAPDFRIIRAGLGDVDLVAPLFDRYRQFYEKAPDAPGARRFIGERVSAGDSVIFLAIRGFGPRAEGIGFTQLYPTFTSVGMARMWTLNDLYVAESARRAGIARKLLEHAAHFAKDSGAARIALLTAHTNAAAKALYESLGWKPDTTFARYTLALA